MLTITSASMTPSPVEVGNHFVISIKVDEIDNTWSTINNGIPNWDNLKNNYTIWKQIKQI